MEFNQTKESVADRTRTTNFEGGEAFEPDSPRMALYQVTINNLLEDTYYQEDTESLQQVRKRFDAVADEDPEWVLKLAAYAREEMYLRDISVLLLVLAARDERTQQYAREYTPAILQRADEPATAIAMNDELFGVALPKPLKKGIKDALHQWDAYQFAKYSGDRRQVSMLDVINRTHPKPQDDEHDEIFERVVRGELEAYPNVEPLETPETWETVLTERGNTRAAWVAVLPRMGLFAIIRNLRNMLRAGVSEATILEELDIEGVRQSKLYPFRFYQSYAAVKRAGIRSAEIERWLSEAVDVSAENLPDRLGKTLVAADLSGSMDQRLSENSSISLAEISSFFGAVLAKKGALASGFGEDFEVLEAHVDTPTLELAYKIQSLNVGHSTNGWKAIRFLRENTLEEDRVILLTDEQLWDSSTRGSRLLGVDESQHTVREEFQAYRDEVAPDATLYIIDLASYGDLSTPEGMDGVYRISGWSEKVLDFIQYAESENEIIDEIENYETRA